MALRDYGKSLVESILAITSASVARRMHHTGALILAYHNILPDGCASVGDVSLHLPQREFADQLEMLACTHDIVSLRDAAERSTREGRLAKPKRPCAAITFDDAYVGAVTAGVAELAQMGLPATIFVTPQFLDGAAFWWDSFTDQNVLNSRFRTEALRMAHGRDSEVRQLAKARGIRGRHIPEYARGAERSQLSIALEHPGISLGSHTWSHPNLNSLPRAQLFNELERSLEWLGSFGDRAVPMISYPYGLAQSSVQNVARDVGYSAGFMIDGGWARHITNRFAIPRLNIPAHVSRNGFALRAAGLVSG